MSLPERRFGWLDIFLDPEQDLCTDGGFHTERETLIGFLRDQRLTLELHCAGLDAAALARRSVPPSNLCLLGLVRQLARVEQTWFRNRMAGGDVPRHFRTLEDRDADLNGARADTELVAEAWRVGREEIAFAEQYVDQARPRPDREVRRPAARGDGAHDRGLRPAQRPRRPDQGANRWSGGPVAPPDEPQLALVHAVAGMARALVKFLHRRRTLGNEGGLSVSGSRVMCLSLADLECPGGGTACA
jgi:hypothetical protein